MSRDDFDAQVTHLLEQENVDLVLCVGYMRILSTSFVSRWSGKCINVHPSLLPDFAGGMDLQVSDGII
jgi:folate-dependent phosphoribosylglycinamide formyltransferase PurN